MIRSAITAMMFAVLPATAQAGPEAEAVIAEAASEIAGGPGHTSALMDKIDVEAIAHFVLGRHSRDLSEKDRSDFTNAFRQFLDAAIRRQAGEFTDAQVDILGSFDRNGRDSIVQSIASDGAGNTAMVRWRLAKRGETWRVVDLQVEGLWLSIELRAQISAILGNPGASIADAIAALDG